MKLPWFRRIGIIFIPVSVIGWVLLAGCITYAVIIFTDIDSRSHSVSDTLINFCFNLILIYAAYSLVAYQTSRSKT